MDWTGGQPFLVQKLCQLVLGMPDPIGASGEAVAIEQLVRSRILENWESQDSHEHLKSIQKRLLPEGEEQRSGRRLGLCQQIVQQGEVAADESPEQTELRLTGLVVKRQGKLQIYNRIYAELFNLSWFDQALAKLRPYGNELNAWVASNRQDESRLLRGQALQEALIWASERSLGDEDYRFLNASQEVEKRVVEEENCILEGARLKAETKTRKANRRLIWSSLIAIALIGLAWFGFITTQQAANASIEQARQKVTILEQKANTLEQKASTLEQKAERAERDRLAARKDVEIATAEREKAQTQADEATIERNKAKRETESAKQATALAERQKIEAQGLSEQAKAEQQRAQAEAREAQIRRDQALRDLGIALEGSGYERNGLRITQRYQLATLDNLVEVMKSGQWLKQQVQDGRPLKDYPAISPIFALQTILGSNTRLRNQLELRQPPERIFSVSYSPDQKHLATGSDTGTIRFWTKSGQPLHHWSTGSAQVLGISFSPDQKHLATATSDGMIKLWDLQGKLTGQWEAHASAVKSVSYSPDGQLLATGGQDGTVKIWTLSGEKQHEWQAYPAVGLVAWDVVPLGVSVRFNPRDRNQLVTAAKDQPVQLWSLSGQLQGDGFSNPHAYGISFSPDGRQLAISGSILDLLGNSLMTYNPNLELDADGPYDNNYAADVSFSPDGKRLITTNTINASIWDLEETSGASEIERSWIAHEGIAWRVYFSPDNQHIATWGDSATGTPRPRIARIWDLSGNKIAEFTNVSSINFDQKGEFLAIGYQNGHIQIWDGSGQRQRTLEWSAHPLQAIGSVSFSPDSQRLLTSGNDRMIRIWDISSKPTPKLLTEWAGSAYAIFSPDGQYIAAIKASGLASGLVLWDLEGQPLAEWRTHNVTRSWIFSPDGQRIATAGDDYVSPVRLWDLSGKELLRIFPHDARNNRIEQASFSPDGQLLATAGIDGTAQLWTLSGLKFAQFAPYGVNGGPWIRSVSFSPDGQFGVAE